MQNREEQGRRYLVITPARNEEAFIDRTIQSMISQSILPAVWIIVNDGSTDRTASIVSSYSKNHPWIKLISCSDRGFRKPGGGVVHAFYEGLKLVEPSDFDFIVKLDADLSFDADYFERLLQRFEEDPTLGIASGACYIEKTDRLEMERNPIDHARGPSKVYRHSCWFQIGGLEPALGWDAIDELKAQMKGWKSRSFEDLVIIHHRPTSTAEGIIKGRVYGGLTSYYVGYHPIYLLLRSMFLMTKRPYILGGLLMIYGYLSGYIKRLDRTKDVEVIRYVRRKQLQSLLPMTPYHKILRQRVWPKQGQSYDKY